MEGSSLAETYQSFLQSALNEKLRHTKVICPDEKEFVSAIPEAHRKGEKAYHVKAFRGSKEGEWIAYGMFTTQCPMFLTRNRISLFPLHGDILWL